MFCNVCKAMLAHVVDGSRWMVRVHTSNGNVELVNDVHDGETVCRFVKTGCHHSHTKELFIAAVSGCGICVRLEKTLRRLEDFPYSPNKGDHRWLKYDVEHWSYEQGKRFSLEISNWDDKRSLGVFECSPIEPENTTSPIKLSNYTGDQNTLSQARRWLSDCDEQHRSSCVRQNQVYQLPRLLQLCEDSIRLVERATAKTAGRYVTLSYCWGRNPQHLTLTAGNIEDFREGLQICKLAKTFQDAIWVTKSLGFVYLWIDALCIMQGASSSEDWQFHVTEMTEIYGNCALNIAADYGKNADSGLFRWRLPDQVRPCTFEIGAFTNNGYGEGMLPNGTPFHPVYDLKDERFVHQLLGSAPLLQRGWVHQERLLSKRILHFTDEQIVWECAQQIFCETYPIGFQKDRPEIHFQIETRLDWYHTVASYSTTILTDAKDKLPAIAGIAKRLCKTYNIKYAAGIFLDDLLGALVWYSRWGLSSSLVRPYRAPSWSWASREGAVFVMGVFIHQQHNYTRIESIPPIFQDPYNPLAQPEQGVLGLKGPLLNVNRPEELQKSGWTSLKLDLPHVPDSLEFELNIPNYKEMPGGSLVAELNFDDSPLLQPVPRTSLLFVQKDKLSMLYGLLLSPVDRPAHANRWTRVGMFWCIGSNHPDVQWQNFMEWLDKWPLTSVEIE